ncbi:MAG TPA: DUF1203 domain-containing protein [Rhabdaerophilum sp.]|nr:DUF1203 domain-containing protein [Rhabdaerophilum sp.]
MPANAAHSIRDLSQPLAIRVQSLAAEPFIDLFALGDAELVQRGARRFVVPENPGIGYPCRVSLAFARAGEEVLLVNHRHLDLATTPYRAEGPVFVRRAARAYAQTRDYPEIVMQREMAVRAYDASGMMVEAELAAKTDLVALTEEWLRRGNVDHVDYHSARRGCFFCRVWRA